MCIGDTHRRLNYYSALPFYVTGAIRMYKNKIFVISEKKCGYFWQSQIFAHVRFSFLQISRKVKLVELRVVLSANINMHIPVILS